MNRTEYKRRSSVYRRWAKSSYAECDRRAGRAPLMPPQPPRSEVGQLLLNQAERRKNKLYWIGLRKREAALDAQPRIPSRIPQIPGWGPSAQA